MRTYVVTGSASGIGAATAARLGDAGHRVVGVDLRDADVVADLSTDAGRRSMVAAVEDATGGVVDAVVACAGIMAEGALCLSVNYFGAVATLEMLRPCLERGTDPRAVTISSIASLMGAHEPAVEACLAGDEPEARRSIDEEAGLAYFTSKVALSRWVRRTAPTSPWAGVGIALNAVAPGTVETPMTAPLLSSEAGRELTDEAVPMPLHGHATPEAVAAVLDFFTSPGTTHVTGQVLFVDGGADAVLRGDATW